MMSLAGGSFTMGSSEPGAAFEETPAHTVTVKPFLIGVTEVTKGQWNAVMGNPGPYLEQCNASACPATSVSWRDAKAFAAALSKKTGKVYRLPTEAEWEYAARAGSTTKWSFGDDETLLIGYARYTANSYNSWNFQYWVGAVSQFAPNPFGLYDMHGNVAEYVEDPYHSSYFGAPTDGSAWLIGGDESRRMLRGGSYTDNATSTRSADRSMNWLPPDTNGSFYTGLRIVREP